MEDASLSSGGAVPAVVDARGVLRFLVWMTGLFVVLHVATEWVAYSDGGAVGQKLQAESAFDLDAEVSVPTWWSQLLLAGAALVCAALALVERQRWGRAAAGWVAVGGGFLWLSVDEGAGLHERLIGPMRSAFDITGGPLAAAWVIPAIALVPFVGLALSRGWRRLPGSGRLWTLSGAGCLIAGSIGIELIGSYWLNTRDFDFVYSLIVAVEEGLEMLGASFLIYGLLTVLRMRLGEGSLSVRLSDSSMR
jgi:hypothetical protein